MNYDGETGALLDSSYGCPQGCSETFEILEDGVVSSEEEEEEEEGEKEAWLRKRISFGHAISTIHRTSADSGKLSRVRSS